MLLIKTIRLDPPVAFANPRTQTIAETAKASFFCNSTSSPGSIVWSRADGSNLPSNALVTDGVLGLISINPSMRGQYLCTVRNQAGEDNVTVELIVIGTASIYSYLIGLL